MRSESTSSNESGLGSETTGATPWRARTESDFSSVLLELARVQRGFQFFGESDTRRQPLADRAHRALAGELERAGDLELTLDGAGFKLAGCDVPIAAVGAIAGLHEALHGQGLRRLRFDPTLTKTALTGLLDLIERGSSRFPSPEYLARALAARDCRGICLNEIDTKDLLEPPRLDQTSRRVSPSISSAHPVDDVQPPDTEPNDPREERPKPTLEAAPLQVVATSDRGERMRARLIELEATTDDDAYRQRVTDVLAWAEDLWNEGLDNDCYRAMLVLASHGVGHGGRTGTQARTALVSLAALATGERLDQLIDRATDTPEPSERTIRAAQILLLLGDRAVPAILDRLCEDEEPDRSAQLRALILTQGEKALPQLLEAISGRDEHRSRLGIRLAGELQNPVVLPVLLETLGVPDLGRRLETIRALSFLPGEDSKAALTNALASDLEAIASAASEALATCDGQDAVPTLLDVLEASLHTPRTELGRTLVELLGRLGDERAVPRLSAILEKRPMIRRAHWHAIQLATIDALAVLPTKEARRSIERASLHAPRPIRDRARQALEAAAD